MPTTQPTQNQNQRYTSSYRPKKMRVMINLTSSTLQKKILSPKIITQSSYILSRSQLSLLNRGPKFTTTTKFNHLTFKYNSKKYSQGVCKLKKYLMALHLKKTH